MRDPCYVPQPCPSLIASATIAICKNGSYRYRADDGRVTDVALGLSGRRPARTIASAHTIAVSPAQALAEPRVTIYQGGALEAVQALLSSQRGSPLVLDFASDSEAGGGWKGKQTGTQEEALCRQSSLGVCLEEHYSKTGPLYMPNMSLVYVPDVLVFRSGSNSGYKLLEQPFNCSVVAGALRQTTKADIHDKIDGVFRVACSEGHRTLVLGAWGCGAFGNDPGEVSAAMAILMRSYAGHLDHLVLALPKERPEFSASFPMVELVSGRQPAQESVDVMLAKWDLLSSVHVDTMFAAVATVSINLTELDGIAAKKQAARRYLYAITAECIGGLVESFSTQVLKRLGEVLDFSVLESELSDMSTAEKSLRADFRAAAQILVGDHFRLHGPRTSPQ